MKMTSAYANKMLKQLDEQKDFLLTREQTGSTYIAALDEDPVIPEYSFPETEQKLREIDEKIARIKHAVNLSNAATELDVGGRKMTIDVILVRMAQLNRRKVTLDSMRKKRNQERRSTGLFSSKNAGNPEFQYLNYQLDDVEREYETVSDEIVQMQLALDRHNQTEEFEVDID